MVKSIFLALVLVLCLLTHCCSGTILTYIVEREIDQDDSYVELSLKVQADGRSLKENIQKAEDVIERIKKIVVADCEQNTKKKSEIKKCQDILEDPFFEIEPKYHMVRKIPTFTRTFLTTQSSFSPTKSPSPSRTSRD